MEVIFITHGYATRDSLGLWESQCHLPIKGLKAMYTNAFIEAFHSIERASAISGEWLCARPNISCGRERV